MYFIFTIYLIISTCGRKTWGHWVRRAPGEEDALIRLSTSNRPEMTPFFVAVSDVEPFISHADGLVDALEDSNHEKQCFRALVGLARATTLLYYRDDVSDGFAHDIRTRLVRLLHAYRYVLPLSNAQESRGDMTQVWRTRYTHHPHRHMFFPGPQPFLPSILSIP